MTNTEPAKFDPWSSRRLVPVGPDGGTVIASFGGHPRGIKANLWPRCAVCKAPMCHMAQVDAGPWLDLGPHRRMSVFICHATGGRCEDWDPWKGANRVLLQNELDDNLYDGPPTVRVYRRVRLGLEPTVDEREVFRIGKERGLTTRAIWDSLRYDKIGGGAVWIHGDDTPQSPTGQGPMRMSLQLTTEIVAFDITKGGMAWVFYDPAQPDESETPYGREATEGTARLLWQGG
jgi:hypothetical protein